MKILKYALYGVGGIVLLVIVAAAIFAATFDPNRYKGQIEAAVKEQTGRTLKLQGDLEVAFFPSLGAKVANVTLSERASAQQFLALEQAHGSVALMPLLGGEVIVDRIRVSGLTAQVIKDKNGKFNFDDLLQAGEEKPAAQGQAETSGRAGGDDNSSGGGVKFDIAGVNVERSSVSYKDLATGKELALADLTLSTGRIARKADGRLQFSTAATGANPALKLDISLQADYGVDLPAKAFVFSGVDASVTGTLQEEAVTAKLTAPRVDLRADKASGEAIVAQFSLKGPKRTVEANLNVAGIQGSAKALIVPKLSASLAVSGPDMPRALKVPLEGSLRADLDKQTASAQLASRFDESNIQAKLGLARFSPPAYLFDIKVDRLNLDQYFPPEANKPAGGTPAPAPAGPAPKPAAAQADTPLDFSAIEGLDADGKLEVGALQARGLKLSAVKAQVKAAKGRLEVNPHSASLYDGTLSGALSLQASGNRVTLKESLSNVSVGPLLRDAAQQDRLEGRGNVVLDLAGAGASVNALKKSLDGSARVNLRDGAIKGIDIAQLLRKVKSIGSKSEEGGADSTKKTDFSALNASFTIRNGVAHNEDLEIKAPLVRVTGSGDIDIGNSRLDYRVKAAVVATTKGQGGAGLENLSGITVPVQLSGSFDDPKYKVDYGAAAADLAKTRVGEKVKEKVDERKEAIEDRVRDRLKGLLKR